MQLEFRLNAVRALKKDKSTFNEKGEALRAAMNPAGHLFVSMCDITKVVVDYWWLSCREIDVSSVGLPSQSMKRVWLGSWIRNNQLEVLDECLIDCLLLVLIDPLLNANS